MQKQTAFECVQAFCRCWFEQKSAEQAVSLLAEDICFVGIGDQVCAQGREQMRAYILRDIQTMAEPCVCRVELVHGRMLSQDLYQAAVSLTLSAPGHRRTLHTDFVLRGGEDSGWMVCSLAAAESGGDRQDGEPSGYPADEMVAQIQQRLLNDAIAGGMMGGYLEAGFPFYFINRRMLDYLGYPDEDAFVADIGGLMCNFIHPEDQAAADECVQRQLAGGDEYAVEYRMKKSDGSYIWIHDTGRKIKTEDGRDAIVSVCVDISEYKRLQERLREKYEQEISCFSTLSSAEGVIQGRMNVTGNLVEMYLATPDMALVQVGERFDQFVTRYADALVDQAEAAHMRETLDRSSILSDFDLGKTEYHFCVLRRRTDGQLFWADSHMRTSQNPESGDIVLFFYTADVTEQHLRQELLDELVNMDYDNIIEIDLLRGTHRFVSYKKNAHARLPDYVSFQEAVQKMADESMSGAFREEYQTKLDLNYMRAQLEQVNSYSFTVEMRDKAGAVRMKCYRAFYINRELGRACLTRTDVTDIFRREQMQREELSVALMAAEQANAAKTNFLSRMSHEIRTPMNAIIGMTTIAAQAVNDENTVSDCLSKIGISSRFLLSLINDILDMSRIESGKMLLKNEEIPTEEFINGINAICFSQAESKGVEYECIADPVLDDYYMGDAMKLQQVLINILSNAIKFTGAGGTVTLSVQQRSRKKDSALLRFIVNDTGVGMGEEFLPHIFEAFSQESTGTTAVYGGTGLGLAISKNIVDLMGGKITVRSIKDIGTEFTVDVTLGLSEKEKLRHSGHREELNFSRLKTLVVDDDVAVCESAVITLKEIGISAEWVDGGQKAVEQVRQMWSKGIYYDLILIDWKMPEMNGIETARRIRAIVGREVTIIIMTAYDWSAIEREAKLAGVNLLMSKPMFKSSLVSAFSKALGEKEDESQNEQPVEFDFTGKRVLLAEDNAINTEVAVKLLKNKGFTVETAKNGLRALELFSKSEPNYYSAILMDIRMPLMDGLTAATSIRNLSNPDAKSVPIIAMTANAFDDDVDKSKAAGMNAHLSKPIDPKRLYQTLYDFISASEGLQQ